MPFSISIQSTRYLLCVRGIANVINTGINTSGRPVCVWSWCTSLSPVGKLEGLRIGWKKLLVWLFVHGDEQPEDRARRGNRKVRAGHAWHKTCFLPKRPFWFCPCVNAHFYNCFWECTRYLAFTFAFVTNVDVNNFLLQSFPFLKIWKTFVTVWTFWLTKMYNNSQLEAQQW